MVRPTSPLHLPAGEKATLFISTPVWLQIKTDSPAKTLRELGVIRPSDTWFGSNTREGELCYAARTPADLDFSAIQRQPHRAISKVEVDNKANSTLLIDRLSLPVVYLPLYAAQDNLLWTPDVSLQREEDGDFAALKIGTSAPSNAKTAKKITDPREVPDKGILVRAFQALFE